MADARIGTGRGGALARLVLTALPLAAVATPAPASVKPCRDASGRVIACAKVRKPVPRCKDASGKFVRCAPPAEAKPARA